MVRLFTDNPTKIYTFHAVAKNLATALFVPRKLKTIASNSLSVTAKSICSFKLQKSFIIYLLLLAVGVNISVWGQNTFYSSGTFTVPVGVTKIKVECWGAGGGGSSASSKGIYGGGGGGGAYASSIILVTSGVSYPIIVGVGGTSRTAGGNSSFENGTVMAVGGNGTIIETSQPGTGGAASSCFGNIKYCGGNGGIGSPNSYSGGGGGGAGNTGSGGNASGSTAGTGTSLNGGTGGAGITADGDGNPGSTYGGGGSGAIVNNNGHNYTSSGANGLVIITIACIDVNATSGTLFSSYFTLKEAFDAINAGIHKGVITIKINGSSTETASAVLNASSGTASYSSILIKPTASDLSIKGSIDGTLIDFSGASNVTFNGSINAEGSSSGMLTLKNTNTGISASTIRFNNSAQNNTLQYCTIEGGGGSISNATVLFGITGTNSGNTVNNCNITNNGTRRMNAIYSATGTNTGNTISNNNIFDSWLANSASSMISLGSGTSSWTISGNSFYESSTFLSTLPGEYDVIRIDNTAGNLFNISGNYIGGNTIACSGTFTKTGDNNPFFGIYLNVGSSSTSSIQNNVIKNISYSNSGNAAWTGIHVAGGLVNIGTVTGNVIGSNTGNSSVSVINGTTDGNVYGINISGTNPVQCNNNSIGSITVATGNTNAANFYGIYKASGAGTTTVSNNVIGSTTTSNSINTSSTTTNSQILYGIYILGSETNNISGNTVANLTNSTTETTLSSRLRGIFANAGSNSIVNNQVFNLKTGGLTNGSANINASLVGISLISNASGSLQNINDNTVYNLENNTTSTTLKFEMYGIYFDGPADVNSALSNNFVHDFIVPAGANTGSNLRGISLNEGKYTLSNNIVSLGNNIGVGLSISGICTNSTKDIKIYFNTVNINGIATSGTSNSYSFQSLVCPSSTDIRNNILWNGRTNSSGSTAHFAISLNCQTNTTVNYNDYNFTQSFGKIGATIYTAFSDWQTNTNPKLDVNSITTNPQLVNPVGQNASDYQLGVNTLTGMSGTGITTDFGRVTRSTPTIGAWEFFSNPVEIWNGNIMQKVYQTLKDAFDDINAGAYTGDLTIKIKGNTIESASAVLYQSGYTFGGKTSSYTNVLIYPARSGVIIKNGINLNSPLISLNGAHNVTFDGRVNAAGSSANMTLQHSGVNSGINSILFINSAQNNTITYCDIQGASSQASEGIIKFSSSGTGTGNNGNTIDHCNITSVISIARPVTGIYSAGSASIINSGNVISNNNIYDIWNSTASSYSININSYSDKFTIIGNSFYETTALTPSNSNTYSFVNLNTGCNHTISNNYMGGSAVLCGGAALSLSNTGSSSTITFRPIYLNVGVTTASTVQGNKFQNISYACSTPTFAGIYVNSGAVSITGNTIGASTNTKSIILNSSDQNSSASSYGIYLNNNLGDVTVSNNNIGSIFVKNNYLTQGHNFYGIYKINNTGNVTISNNTIGSTSSLNSIEANSTSTSSTQSLYGIYSLGTGTITISDNTIANLTNSTTRSDATNSIYGIYSDGSSSNIITRNFINSFSLACITSSALNLMIGINLVGSTVTCSNNIVYLNSNYNYAIYGIKDIGVTSITKKVYHNTIYLSGTLSSNFTSDAAFYKLNNVGTLDIRNNIFYNSRSGGSAGYHYAINMPGIAGLTIDYNDYFVDGNRIKLGRINLSDYTSLANWKSATSQDASSQYIKPAFYTVGSTLASEYKVAASLDCIYLSDVPVDYGMSPRGSTMGAWELFPNKWKGAGLSTDWDTKENWTGNRVPPEDANIEFDATTINNCYMNSPHSVNDIINAQSTYLIYTNGKKLTLKGDLNLSNGAQIDASSPCSSIEFAGASPQIIAASTFSNNNVNNLIINNVNNVTLNGTLNILNTIKATSGRLDAITGNTTVNYKGSIAQTINDSCYLNNKVYNLGINNALGVTLNTDFTVTNNMIISSGSGLTIPVAKVMTVQNTITNNSGASGLIIKASSSEVNGSLIFNNALNSPVLATVEMYSKAFCSNLTPPYLDYKWQYFGIPVDNIPASPTFDGSYVRSWDQSKDATKHWVPLANNSVVMPFYGYEITQKAAKKIIFQGKLINKNFSLGPLTITSTAAFPGQYIFANPYTAAINIKNLNLGTGAEQTVYMYNTGSMAEWDLNKSSTTQIGGVPGQYTAIPIATAGGIIQGDIPSMQAILIRPLSEASNSNYTINITYSSVIMKNATPQRVSAFKTQAVTDEKIGTLIEVKGANFSDRMWLFSQLGCSHKFDNGWDGTKMMGSVLTPQIFAMEQDGNYQVNTADDINNTQIGFQAGQDKNYTITFTHLNIKSKYSNVYLYDISENKTVDITESGSTYSFVAESTPTPLKRFIIFTRSLENDSTVAGNQLKVATSGNTVFVQNFGNQNGEMSIYDTMGNHIRKATFGPYGVTAIQVGSISGAYIVNAATANEKVSEKFIIGK